MLNCKLLKNSKVDESLYFVFQIYYKSDEACLVLSLCYDFGVISSFLNPEFVVHKDERREIIAEYHADIYNLFTATTCYLMCVLSI